MYYEIKQELQKLSFKVLNSIFQLKELLCTKLFSQGIFIS